VKEIKSSKCQTKTINGRTVIGVFAVFGNFDSYRDRIMPGAFAKTIQERSKKIYHLWQHSFGEPAIATVTGIRELSRDELPSEIVLEYPEALGGVEVTREYLDTPRANEVLEGLKAGVPYEMSFGFDAIKTDYEEIEGRMVRNVREVRLYETSDVLWGANSATLASKALLASIVQRNGIEPEQVEACKTLFGQLDKILGGDPLTPDFKAGKVLSSKNVGRLEGAITELQNILAEATTDPEKSSQPVVTPAPTQTASNTAPLESHAAPAPALENPNAEDQDLKSLFDSVNSLASLPAELEFERQLHNLGNSIITGA
jgi:HK97 family phage prohead protease